MNNPIVNFLQKIGLLKTANTDSFKVTPVSVKEGEMMANSHPYKVTVVGASSDLITIDTEIDKNSSNPVANYAIAEALEEGGHTLPVATTTRLGGIKVGDGLDITNDGKLSATATSSYNSLTDKPSINNITLIDNKTGSDLHLQDKMDEITNQEIDNIIYGV